jgi:hypothetical protein
MCCHHLQKDRFHLITWSPQALKNFWQCFACMDWTLSQQKSCFVCFNSMKSVLRWSTPCHILCKNIVEKKPHLIKSYGELWIRKKKGQLRKWSLIEHCWKCFTSPNDPIWTHKLNHLGLKTVFGRSLWNPKNPISPKDRQSSLGRFIQIWL